MDHDKAFEKIAMSIASLEREEITHQILTFKGRFSLDFTPDYLDGLSIDRLRHILLAALSTNSNAFHP